MAGGFDTLVTEAETLGLFRPHTAFEVHCANCHGRLNPLGDCDTCGLIGRTAADARRRAGSDAAAAERWLGAAIAKRKAYRPSGKAAREE